VRVSTSGSGPRHLTQFTVDSLLPELLEEVIPWRAFPGGPELPVDCEQIIAMIKLAQTCRHLRREIKQRQPAYALLLDGASRPDWIPDDWRKPQNYDKFRDAIVEEMQRRTRILAELASSGFCPPTQSAYNIWWAAQLGGGSWRYDYIVHVYLVTSTWPDDGEDGYFDTLSKLPRLQSVTFHSPNGPDWELLEDFTPPFMGSSISVGWVLSTAKSWRRVRPFLVMNDFTGPVMSLEVLQWPRTSSLLRLMVAVSETLTTVSLRFCISPSLEEMSEHSFPLLSAFLTSRLSTQRRLSRTWLRRLKAKLDASPI
jgi:hypothetical protein